MENPLNLQKQKLNIFVRPIKVLDDMEISTKVEIEYIRQTMPKLTKSDRSTKVEIEYIRQTTIS